VNETAGGHCSRDRRNTCASEEERAEFHRIVARFMERRRRRSLVHPVKQIFHCFGCGKGGDVFSFVMEMEKVP